MIIVVKIITDRTKCWNAFLRHLLRHTRKLINCFKKDTFRDSMLFITSIAPETKLITVGPIIQGVSVNYCHFQLNSALAIANLFI